MTSAPVYLPETCPFSPEEDFDAFLKRTPARWVVCLLADMEDRPVQLLCVKNLRNSLRRRLGGDETVGPTKRVDYRELIRRVHWRRVDSAFEADWIYHAAARELFPNTYQGMVGYRPAWFIHIDAAAAFPRYTKTIDLSAAGGLLLGPLEDKHAAARLIQLVEDAFDLCRYHHILVESPNAKACAYKEMGRCPAPCDGSISMEQYRQMVELSARVLVDPDDFVREQTERMKQAAANLQFETAAKIKAVVAKVTEFGKGAFRHVRRLEDFEFISLQRGPRERTAKVFHITPGRIEEVAGLIGEPSAAAALTGGRLGDGENLGSGENPPVGAPAALGVVSHHLFMARQTSGVFLPVRSLDDKTLVKGFRELQKQKINESADEEGLLKEFQAV